MEVKNSKRFLMELCVLLFQANLGNAIWYRNTSNYGLENRAPSIISPADVIGDITHLMDQILSQFTYGKPRPREDSCKIFTLPISGTELEISPRPRGHCSYCCPLDNPSDHIWLHFTNKLTTRSVQIRLNQKPGALRAAGVDRNSPTVIYVHGFSEHGLGVTARAFRDAYLSRSENYNVIQVDWGRLAAFPWYPIAARNTRVVAALLAKFLQFYNDTGELPISRLHIIGFSLGGQIAGFVGKFLRGKLKIPRITALDPAFPQFSLTDTSQRISKSDADYVDVIHTDGGVYGLPISIGHADFYPNGGTPVQPGCEVSRLIERNMLDRIVLCGHFHAVRFYVESVRNPSGFPATKCGIMEKGFFRKCRFIIHGYMGFSASKSTTLGNFYLTTNDHAPFAKSAEDQEAHMKAVNLLLP